MSHPDSTARTAARAAIDLREVAVAAASWWAEQLGAPIHKIVTDDATGEDREIGDSTFMAMQIISSRHPVTAEQGQQFVADLSGRIEDDLARRDQVSLGVDYGPDMSLAEPAVAAGIHLSRFPFKTHMRVTPNYVTASLGYRAPSKLVWQAPDWERPACGTHDYDADFNALDGICTRPIFHEGDHGDWVPDPARCETCGGSYVDHYRGPVYPGHSWKPAVLS